MRRIPTASMRRRSWCSADTDHGGFDHGENAMVNLPFGSGLGAVRIVGSYSRDAGWIDRVVIAPGEFPVANGSTRGDVLAAPIANEYHDVNDVERTTVRVSALLKPIDGLSITPLAFSIRSFRPAGCLTSTAILARMRTISPSMWQKPTAT